MEFELWDDVAPKHVASFLKLTSNGFYDGGAFHRIIPGFVIQGGDPNAKKGYGPNDTLEGADAGAVRKWGTGGPGYNIPQEFNERIHEFGVLSMARSADPNSAGSQFFVRAPHHSSAQHAGRGEQHSWGSAFLSPSSLSPDARA